MIDKILLDEYLKTTGQDEKEIMSGVYAFGRKEVESFLKQCISEKSKVEFYYQTDQDILIDKLSHKITKLRD